MRDRIALQATEDEELNLTPLLDCIFILIFFFLVATNLREERAQLEVQLPQASLEASQAAPESILITIAADGGLLVGEQRVESGELETALAAATRSRPGVPIEVVSDASAPMQAFVDVATTLSRLNITFADLRTRPLEDRP